METYIVTVSLVYLTGLEEEAGLSKFLYLWENKDSILLSLHRGVPLGVE